MLRILDGVWPFAKTVLDSNIYLIDERKIFSKFAFRFWPCSFLHSTWHLLLNLLHLHSLTSVITVIGTKQWNRPWSNTSEMLTYIFLKQLYKTTNSIKKILYQSSGGIGPKKVSLWFEISVRALISWNSPISEFISTLISSQQLYVLQLKWSLTWQVNKEVRLWIAF